VVRLTARSAELFLLQCIHTASGNHSVSHSVATKSSFPKITMCRYIHFQSLMIDSHIVFPAFYCSALSITTDRASACIAETNKIFVSRATSSNGNSVCFFNVPFSHSTSGLQIRSFWYCSHLKILQDLHVNIVQNNIRTHTTINYIDWNGMTCHTDKF
jgi:hypothetical protein